MKVSAIPDTLSAFTSDSLKATKSGQLYLATNFRQLQNFHNDNNYNLNFIGKLNLNRDKISSIYKSKQEFIADIALTQYIDSVLEVEQDEIEFNTNWDFVQRSWLSTININIKSQLTNSTEYVFIKNEFIKVPAKLSFIPFIISLGTGFNYNLDNKIGIINFSPVDIKTTLLTNRIILNYPKHSRINSDLYYLSEVGSSITISILKNLSKEKLIWRNNSRIFIKDFTKEGITANLKNRFYYEIYKWINISFENQMVYDPIYNYKLQLRNEMILGVSFRE